MFPDKCNKKIGKRFSLDNKTHEDYNEAQLEIKKENLGEKFEVYAVVGCSSIFIDLRNGFIPIPEDSKISELSRENLGVIVVAFDLLVMTCFLIAIWFINNFVRIDAERHKNMLLETKDFALEFWRLPNLN